jgi:hypothetical protein
MWSMAFLLMLAGCSTDNPGNVRRNNPHQGEIRRGQIHQAVENVLTGEFTHVDDEKEAIRKAVLSVLKGKQHGAVLNVETTIRGLQPLPFVYIRRDGSILVIHRDMHYDLKPIVAEGIITGLVITGTPTARK